MSGNDPRRNTNNLLFRPNNSIDDDQPSFFFYTQPEAPQNTSNTLGTTTQANISQNISGSNNNLYQPPSINQWNLSNVGREQTNSLTAVVDNLRQSISPPKQVTTAPLFPPSGISPRPTIPEPVPSVILFSNAGLSSKPVVTEPAQTISTFSTAGISSKPTVSEVQSIPLFSTPVVSNPVESVPLFSSEGLSPKPIVTEATQTVSLCPADRKSSNPLAAFFSSEEIFVKPTVTDSTQLFPADFGPKIPFFSARRTPPSTIASEPAEALALLTANIAESVSRAPIFPSGGLESERATSVPLFSPADLLPQPTETPSTASTNTYRRIGSKRPVYAPIPGLQNQQPQASHQIQPQHSHIADYFSSPTSSLTPHYTNQKHINQSDSSQVNSPFLSPVSEPPVLSSGDSFNSAHIPEMSNNNAQIPTSSNYMFSNDGRLPAVTESVSKTYKPPYYHWFYKKEIDTRVIWAPFSLNDSINLENNFTSVNLTLDKNISTDGGRFDVNILRRQRTSVYWNSKPFEVRRCSWFHKSHMDGKHVPFEENIATKLEEEYKSAMESNIWPKKVELPAGESVTFHTPDVLVLFTNSQPIINLDNSMQEGQSRQRVVKRGIDESILDEGESEVIDHLLFMVHGIGSGCDLKFRSVEEVVDDFRNVALQLIRTHYRSSSDKKIVHRVEILPISWHNKLHSEDTGIDNKLKSITLESIPKLREFTNDTLLDILFYSSPFYGQTIISTVGTELNRLYGLFKQRNPNFHGGISLAGHSLGSLILFDILCNQIPLPKEREHTSDDELPIKSSKPHPLNRRMSRRISYMVGHKGTGQAQVNYPILNFQPVTFFALGSPIGMFVTIRGLDHLGEKFVLPTCPGFFNIFHPYDPVAYRIEALVNPQLGKVKPVLIPHHKGRKRMHLELKETMAKVGSDLKQKLVDSMKNTWNSLLGWSNTKPSIQPAIAEEVDKVLEQFASKHSNQNGSDDQTSNEAAGMNLGMLNKGRRIDHVLQEAPVEFFNEYIFALTSHVCYWESEDTVLLILKEIYSLLNVSPDCQIPQQTMTIETPLPLPGTSDQHSRMGVDPTMPIRRDTSVGPPPLTGFVKQS